MKATAEGDYQNQKLVVTPVVTTTEAVLRVTSPDEPGLALRVVLTPEDLRELLDASERMGEFVEIEGTPGAVVGLAVQPAGV